MSKDRNRIQGLHLKRLLTEMQISQNRLATELEKNEGYNILPQQRISTILKGKGKLQQYQAEAIHKLFPHYRIPWLLGIDIFPTEDEYQKDLASRQKNRADQESTMMNHLLTQLADKSGYRLYTVYFGSYIPGTDDPEGGDYADFTLARGADRVRLSPATITAIESELIRYSSFLFWEAFNEGKERE